jgi:hypothetical protein
MIPSLLETRLRTNKNSRGWFLDSSHTVNIIPVSFRIEGSKSESRGSASHNHARTFEVAAGVKFCGTETIKACLIATLELLPCSLKEREFNAFSNRRSKRRCYSEKDTEEGIEEEE